MRKGDRLRALKMRVARHDGVGVLFRLDAEGGDELRDELYGLRGRVAQVEPRVDCYLVVTAASGVQLAAGVAETLGEDCLYEAVYVLGGGVYGEFALINVREYAAKALDERLALGGGDDALLGEHRRVGHASSYILPVHPAVYGDGRVEVVRRLVQRAVRAAGPELFHIISPCILQRGGG